MSGKPKDKTRPRNSKQNFIQDNGDASGKGERTEINAGGHKIVFSKDSNDIKIMHGNGQSTISIGQDGGISISGGSSTNIRAPQFNFHADGDINFHAGANVNIRGSQNVTIEGGSNVNVNGKSTLNLDSAGQVNVISDGTIATQSGGVTSIKSGGDCNLNGGPNVNLNSGGAIAVSKVDTVPQTKTPEQTKTGYGTVDTQPDLPPNKGITNVTAGNSSPGAAHNKTPNMGKQQKAHQSRDSQHGVDSTRK